jgi:hypothetical protein
LAAIVSEGRSAILVRYDDWAHWRIAQGGGVTPFPLLAEGTCFCAGCWGQGRILTPAANGEGLIPLACPTCMGLGIV